MFVPARRPELARGIGYATSIAIFGLALFLLFWPVLSAAIEKLRRGL